MPAQLAALRKLIEHRFPDAVPLTQRVARPVATGIAALDRILPGGGLPRGKLTTWAPHGAGAMALLRGACHAVRASGERAAWIHGAGTVGPFWDDGALLIQPKGRMEALVSAEVVLRSGGFALVVLTGVDPEGTETVRLTRAVREGGGAFVALTANAALAMLRLTSRILPHRYRWRRGPFDEPALPEAVAIDVQARALGWNARTTVTLPIASHDVRLSLDPELVDRRGCPR
ncbi:MAG: hypothetical protein IRY91_06450 [Gemmatimonadaceae bacterium]|nr:hypothetical protein [Gemmatimonadaceae bacterium]